MASGLPLVTIVTPAYNQASFLTETIRSVLDQSYPAIEYIVIDDGSTDHTPEILGQFGGQLTAISRPNKGQALTLNEGWARARGQYLGYLSSDDILRPTAIAELVAVMEADPSIVCGFPDCDLIDAGSVVVRRNVCRPFDLAALVVEQECYIGPGALFRASAFAEVGGWRPDLRLAPDREFWMRLARFGRFHFLPVSLAGYRLHPESISYRVVSEQASMEYLAVLDAYFAGSVPPEIAARRDEAYGRAHLLIARNCFRGLRFDRGMHHYHLARTLHPPLSGWRTWAMLGRTIVSKPVRVALARLRRLLGQ